MTQPVTAERWNDLIPVGYRVRYWPGEKVGDGHESVTRSRAWTLGDGTPVVKVAGYAGGIILTHVDPLVFVDRLYVGCAYSTTDVWRCSNPATCAVIIPGKGFRFRCTDHRNLIGPDTPGGFTSRVHRRFDQLPENITSARRMLETEDHYAAVIPESTS